MRESHSEDVASHAGPESCADVREGSREALTGVCTGQVLRPETMFIECVDAVIIYGRQYRWGSDGPACATTS